MLTGSWLERTISYNPETGEWHWIKCTTHNSNMNGEIAGNVRSDGYRKIRIGGTAYYSGRLAWLWMTGKWPKEEIDHIDRDPSNDKWDNLREATSSDNKCNQRMRSTNTSGFRGISWNKKLCKWVAYASTSQLGAFDNLEAAIAVRDRAAAQIQGAFAQLNTQTERV